LIEEGIREVEEGRSYPFNEAEIQNIIVRAEERKQLRETTS
jgi:hypothetical protein